MMSTARAHAWAAAAFAALGAVYELVRLLVAGAAVPGMLPAVTIAFALAFVAILGGAAVGMALHRSFGWTLGVLAATWWLAYGTVALAAGGRHGAVYLIGGLVQLYFVVRSLADFRVRSLA